LLDAHEVRLAGCSAFSVAVQFPSNKPFHILAPSTYHRPPNGPEFCSNAPAELASYPATETAG